MPEPTIQFGRVILHDPENSDQTKSDCEVIGQSALKRLLFSLRVKIDGRIFSAFFQLPVSNEKEGLTLKDHFDVLAEAGEVELRPRVVHYENNKCKTG